MTTDSPFSLDAAEAELDDAQTVLACLDRTEPGICETCSRETAAGTLARRPTLQACAEARSQAPS